MRVLAVLYCFPPLQVPAAVRYFKVVLGLRELGVEVEPVLIDPRSFSAPEQGLNDPELAGLVPSDLRTHVVWSPENHPAVRLLKRFHPIRRTLYRIFEPRKKEWTFAARRALGNLDLRQYDVILSCSQPHANHLLGMDLAVKSGLPWVAWFGDPWSRNPYSRPSSPAIAAYLRELETRVLRKADFVFYTSDEMLRLAESEFPGLLTGKSGVLPHLFVPAWYGAVPVTYERKARIEILHTGHFYGPRSPRLLLEVLGRLHRESSLEGTLHIVSYGNIAAGDVEFAHARGLENIFETRSVVPYLHSLALMKQADYLLLIDAQVRDSEESVFLPSKLVDYLGSGKPVLALTPRHGASARVVSATGGVVCEVGDEKAVETLLRGVIAGGPGPGSNPEAIREYEYQTVARKLQRALERATGLRAPGREIPEV